VRPRTRRGKNHRDERTWNVASGFSTVSRRCASAYRAPKRGANEARLKTTSQLPIRAGIQRSLSLFTHTLEQRAVYARGSQTHHGMTRNQEVELVSISRAPVRVCGVCVLNRARKKESKWRSCKDHARSSSTAANRSEYPSIQCGK